MRFLALLPIIAGPVQASTISNGLLDASLDHLAELLMGENHLPGLSIAILYNGTKEAKGYGFSKLPSTPATADSLYFTGSTTKAFTAAAAGLIVHNKSESWSHVKWSTPISQLLPGDFVLSREYESSHITLEDALSHRSGLPRHDMAYGWNNKSALDNVKLLRDLPFSAEPRTRWQYNNMMYLVAGEVVSKLIGNPLDAVLRDWFWKPLGMISTTFSLEESKNLKDAAGNDRMARGYFWTGKHFVPDAYIDILSIAGAGATISSVNDYSLWAQALLDAASNRNSSSPMTGALYKDLVTPRAIIQQDGEKVFDGAQTYALGWTSIQMRNLIVINHSGGLPGFGTMVYLIPNHNVAFVAMGNAVEAIGSVAAPLFTKILETLEIEAGGAHDGSQMSAIDHVHGAMTLTDRIGKTHAPKAQPYVASQPLPGNTEEYTGIYHHPSYGSFHVSIISSEPSAEKRDADQYPLTPDNEVITFSVEPSARVWPQSFTLKHSDLTTFVMDSFSIRGLASYDTSALTGCEEFAINSKANPCKNQRALQPIDTTLATFEFGLHGQVERLGMQLERELIDYFIREGGEQNWRESMIWFSRV